jgi:hypothetical protein
VQSTVGLEGTALNSATAEGERAAVGVEEITCAPWSSGALSVHRPP